MRGEKGEAGWVDIALEGGGCSKEFYGPGGDPGVDLPSTAVSRQEDVFAGEEKARRVFIRVGWHISSFDEGRGDQPGWAEEPEEQVGDMAEVVEDEPTPVIGVAEPLVGEPGGLYGAMEPSGGDGSEGVALEEFSGFLDRGRETEVVPDLTEDAFFFDRLSDSLQGGE